MQYKVVEVHESGLSVIFLGGATLPIQRVELELNKAAAEGWELAFQVMEKKRFLLFWQVDRMVITFKKA